MTAWDAGAFTSEQSPTTGRRLVNALPPPPPPFHPLKHLRYTRDLGSSTGHSLARLRTKRICPPPSTRRGQLSVRLRAAMRYTVRIGPLAWSVLRLREYLCQFDIHVGYFNIKCRHHVLHQSLYCRTIQVFFTRFAVSFFDTWSFWLCTGGWRVMSVSDDGKPSEDDNSVRKYGEQYSNRRHFSCYTTVDEAKRDSWSQRPHRLFIVICWQMSNYPGFPCLVHWTQWTNNA